MNRKKVYNDPEILSSNILTELENSLLIIKDSHHSNELVVNKLNQVVQSEQHAELYNALQKDMELIGDQLNTLLGNLKTVKSTK